MKLTIMFIMAGIIQVVAINSYSQTTRLTFELKGSSVADVLKVIEKQSEFYFAYNKDAINLDRKLDLTAKNLLVEEILDQLFRETNVKYKITDRHIILSTLELVEPQKSVSGKVNDSSGASLPGVSVVVKGTTTGVITDMEGKYSLVKVSENAVLQFSFVGMKTQEIAVGGKTTINVTLVDETIGIDEVVAIGYGTIKKQDLTGSVTSIEGEKISERKTLKVSEALQGAMPGIMVNRNSGGPGQDATIRIRGITTIGNTSPLTIIDGIAGNIADISPFDIESISVLKDAASASIYGSRAASGVILITTKRAKKGELNLNFILEKGFEKPTMLPELEGSVRSMQIFNECQWNDINYKGSEYPTYSKERIDNYNTLHKQNPDLYPEADWQKLLVRDFAPKESYILSITAGGNNIQTKASLAYDNVDALYENRNYKRYTARFNNDIQINSKISVKADISLIRTVDDRPIIDLNQVFYDFYYMPFNAPVWSDGRITQGNVSRINPYGIIKEGGFNKTWSNSVNGKFRIDFSPIRDLNISGIFSPNFNFNKGKKFVKQVPYTTLDDPNKIAGYVSSGWSGITTDALFENRIDSYEMTSQFIVDYKKILGLNNFSFMTGFENYYNFNENLGASSTNYSLTSYPYLDLGNDNYRYNNGSAYEIAYRSLFGRIIYNYNNKYLLQSNLRYDGSSRFAEKYRWGFFPSLSLGWIITKESFMPDISWLTNLKLRASWGALGNDRIGNYPYQSTIGFGQTLVYHGNSVVSVQDASINKYAIRDISWESTESVDFGVDAYFFDNKLTFTGDLYKKSTKDMLLNLQIPKYIGLDNPSQNAGSMYTKGWEFVLGWNDKIGELAYSVSLNLSDFRSIMGDLGGTEFLGSMVKFKGSEFNEWYGYKSDGLFQTSEEVAKSPKTSNSVTVGDVKYIDLSGVNGVPDGKISPEYDRVLLGGSLPRYQYGGNIHLGYKNFDLSIGIQGVGKINVLMNQNLVSVSSGDKLDPKYLSGTSWSKYNTDEQNLKARFPRFGNASTSNNYAASDFWLANGAYLRVKNIELSYRLPLHLMNTLLIRNAKVYANVTNPFVIGGFLDGVDPEGYEGYWMTKSLNLGLSINF